MIRYQRARRANREPRKVATVTHGVPCNQWADRFSRLQAENAELRRRAADLALAIQALRDPFIGLRPPKLKHRYLLALERALKLKETSYIHADRWVHAGDRDCTAA